MDPSQYPRFADGDVLITAPTGLMWRLHSHILAQFSSTFRHLLQKDPSHTAKKQRTDGRHAIHWEFTMQIVDQHELYVEFRPVNLSPKQPFTLPVSLRGRGSKLEYLTTYDNLFRCIYNLDPDLDYSGATNSLTHRSVHLIIAAERIDAVRPVRRSIESHLLRLGHVLWQRVIAKPHLFADLAIRLESPTIFKEAMIHIVGAWNFPEGMRTMDVSRASGDTMNASIIKELAARKVEGLEEWKYQVENHLIAYVPPCLGKVAINGSKAPSRADYANDIYLWQAFTLVRQHISTVLVNGNGRIAQDGGALFYSQLNRGAYLGENAVKSFLEDFPMSDKARRKFDDALKTVKEQFMHLTAGLLVNKGMPFAIDAPPFRYLTVADIDEEDYPWHMEGKKAGNDASVNYENNMDSLQQASRRLQASVAAEASSSFRNAPNPLAASLRTSLPAAEPTTNVKRNSEEAFGVEEEECKAEEN